MEHIYVEEREKRLTGWREQTEGRHTDDSRQLFQQWHRHSNQLHTDHRMDQWCCVHNSEWGKERAV